VWGPSASDPHVVEVTVARLRRRLGELGDSVVVVPRRGYLLDAAAS
jgi:DNA-binding winged helix-turn-helix (wHTH) protein